ncbi:MAG: ABC transporter ATP-binding protein [Oleiphilus sp.]|nr:MAG: ABC transporter ATP-binding protein [Oleiphilus sp.]
MAFFAVNNLAIHFGGIKAVDGVSFEVNEGEVFTIIGPNGAGKSTIFNMISRIYDPSDGSIEFEGQELTDVPAHKVAGLGIARTFQNIELFERATVLQNLLVGRHAHRKTSLLAELLFMPSVREQELRHREAAEKVIDFLDLQPYRNQMITNLPYGVRKNVELARALCIEPKILLLDEPASGLTVEETRDMGFWIDDIRRDFGITVIMVEHNMGLVNQVSDRVLAINNGRFLAEGTAAQVQAHPEVQKAYLGA